MSEGKPVNKSVDNSSNITSLRSSVDNSDNIDQLVLSTKPNSKEDK